MDSLWQQNSIGHEALIVSVTVLGAAGRSQESIADDIVGYLENGRVKSRAAGRRPGSVIELPAPEGGTVSYYADSAGLRPGRWALGGSGEIDTSVLATILSGVDPVSGERLLTGSGHAGRSEHARNAMTRPDPDAQWYTSREAAVLLEVSDSYVQRLCRAAVIAGDEEASEGIERAEDGRGWKIHRDALARLSAQRKPKRIVVGYDLTYSVPKSVSVLWAGADEATQQAVLEAFDEAVAAGTRYIERHALVVRQRGEQQRAGGVFAADYLHATSRALEPQLHHHVVVANYGRGKDGAGRALDARMLFLHAKTASYVAGAELRHQLTARLGVRWEKVANGIAEIEGIPEAARAEMSTRSKEIASALDELGFHSPRARQVAAWDTRAAKDHGVDIDALVRSWDERLSAAGYNLPARAAVLGQVPCPSTVAHSDVAKLFSDLVRVAGITANEAIFDRRRVVQVIAEFAGDRLSGDAIDELADRFLAQPAVVRLEASLDRKKGNVIRRQDGTVVVMPEDAIYSTRSMLELERRALSLYEQGRCAVAGIVPQDLLAEVLGDDHFARLSDEQRRFVSSLTTSGMRIQAAVGGAGTGKTTALEAAVTAWSRAGFTVLGSAVGGTQTVILGEEAHVDARTVASVLARYFNFGDADSIDAHTVLLIDEASLLSTQDFALLAQAATERGATMRVIGDPAQHSAVAAGGIFRYLVEHHPEDAPALTEIYRQQGPAMAEVRLANAEYRAGKITEALARLEHDGRITEAESAEEAFDLLSSSWYVERCRRLQMPGRKPTSMTAEHHFERIELNARARALLKADGTLSGPELVAAGLSFQCGDEVIARIGAHDLRAEGAARSSWVRNGSLGVVRRVESDSLVVDFERWGRVVVPSSYIEREVAPGIRGALQHAYALTTYAAEGSTFAVAVPLLTDASSRGGVYVGITRGQFDLSAVVIRRRALIPPLTDDALPILVDETAALRAMALRLESEGPERLASEVDPFAPSVNALAQRHTLAELTAINRQRELDAALCERALHERARIVGTRAVIDPGTDVLVHFGSRPSEGAKRSAWDQAVATIAVWREREGAHPLPDGPSVTWALGEWPDEVALQEDYEVIAELIETADRWPHDAWMVDADSDEVGDVWAPSVLTVEAGECAPSYRDLSDDELRDYARALRREVVRHEVRLTGLDRVVALRAQLTGSTPEEENGTATEERERTPKEARADALRSSLDWYRAVAEEVRAEATRRGLVSKSRDFLAVVGGDDMSTFDPPPEMIATVDGPVLVP